MQHIITAQNLPSSDVVGAKRINCLRGALDKLLRHWAAKGIKDEGLDATCGSGRL